MYAKLYGATLHGIDGCIITVEVDISQGLPVFDIVGLPNQSVKEARERVRAAIKNSGYEFPMRRIVVNLAPATIRKSSAGLDLAIALGILLASGQIKGRKAKISALFDKSLFMGELALDGSLLPTFGTLAMSLAGLDANYSKVYTSIENSKVLQAIPNLTIYGGSSLQEIITILEEQIKPKVVDKNKQISIKKEKVDKHNANKSILGSLESMPLTGSNENLDTISKPQVTMITINRSQGNYIYPANFICILAANPCPCGYYHDPHKECVCTETMVKNYQQRLSGPIMDRIDLHIPVERPTLEQLLDTSSSNMTSESMRQQVIMATAMQQKRYEGFDFNSNGAVPLKAISELCNITDKAWSVLGNIFDHFHLSGRAFDRILKVARTIADLEENPKVEPHHISEAMLFRTGK